MTEKINWSYCPSCGIKLPQIDKLNFCTNCGVDLNYIIQHKTMPDKQKMSTYKPSMPSYTPQVYHEPDKTLLADDEILDTEDKELWGTGRSIGFPFLSYVLMLLIVEEIAFIILLLTYPNIEYGIRILNTPLFFVFALLIELIFIMLPLIWAGKNLENKSFKNRLILLGFTTRKYDRKGTLKEVGIGIGFALIGIVLVVGSSIAIQFFFSFFFTFDESPGSSEEALITGFDVFMLIIMILMMLIIVGPCEEILFRGFMMKGLTRTLGKKSALWLTALIFTGMHLVGILFYFFIYHPIVVLVNLAILFVPYLAISLMLGFLYRWRNENLIANVITHGVYNSLTLLIVFLFTVFY